MTGLKNLLALQKAKKTESIPNEVPTTSAGVRSETDAESQAELSAGADQSGSVPPESSESQAAHGNAPASSPARSSGLGLNRLGALNAGQAGSNKPVRQPSGRSAESARPSVSPTPSGPGEDGPVEFSLDDIAKLDESTTPVVERSGSGFDDEIEATAPDRELPAELTSQQLGFVESLDGMYQVLNDPEMFGQTVRMIMMELQENPEYEKLISDQDVHTMIRAMRNTMGLARIKKQEKSRKAKGTTAAKKRGALTDDIMGLLDGVAGDDD